MDPSCTQSTEYRGCLLRGQGDRGVELTTRVHILSMLWVEICVHTFLCFHDMHRDNFTSTS